MDIECCGLMDHGGDRSRYPNLSRDWEDINCKATRCVLNELSKCISPSRAKIDEDGKCLGFTTEKILEDKTSKMLGLETNK